MVLELKPILMSEDEIRALLTSIDEASIREARKHALQVSRRQYSLGVSLVEPLYMT